MDINRDNLNTHCGWDLEGSETFQIHVKETIKLEKKEDILKKVKLIVILALVLVLSILVSVPTNAAEGYEQGAKGSGPYGIDTCYCSSTPFDCWCYHPK